MSTKYQGVQSFCQAIRSYQSLSEQDRRRYAAIAVINLGYGKPAYIRQLFGYHHQTLALGIAELDDETALEQEKMRQVGVLDR
jgi:hypothetical protein